MAVTKRTRNFATVVYPESAPEHWQDILAEQFVPAFVSPLHDKDINPGGEPKKPHYHVVIMYDGVKTAEQATQLFKMIGGVGCEVVNSIRGYARYLCHMDNPEKYQYAADDVTCYAGADYLDVIGLASDKYKVVDEIIEFCEENQILSYRALINYARVYRRDWFRCLCDNITYVIKEYLKSKLWEVQMEADEDTYERLQEVMNNITDTKDGLFEVKETTIRKT